MPLRAPARAEAAPVNSSPLARRWPGPVRALMIATFLVRAAGIIYPFLPYLLHARHLPTAWAGLVTAAFGAGWLIGSLGTGWATDRIGRRATLTCAMLIAAVDLPLLAAAPNLPILLATTIVAGSVFDAPRPLLSAALADLVDDDRVRASINAWRHFAINVGAAAVGAGGGLLAAHTGIPALVCANGVVCAAVALLSWRWVDDGSARLPKALVEASRGVHPLRVGDALRDVRLQLLSMATLAALTCASAIFSALPLLMTRQGLSAADYGYTQVANAVAVLLLSPLLNRQLARRAAGGRPMTGVLPAGSAILGLTMGAAGLAENTVDFAVPAAAAVPGEILVFVAAGDLLVRISPIHGRGLYAGVWGTTLAGGAIVAPLLTSASLSLGGGTCAAAALALSGLIGAALCLPLASSLRSQTPDRPRRQSR